MSLEVSWINFSATAGGLEGMLGKMSGLRLKTKQPQASQRAQSKNGGRWLLEGFLVGLFSENGGEKRKTLLKLCFEAFWPGMVWKSLPSAL